MAQDEHPVLSPAGGVTRGTAEGNTWLRKMSNSKPSHFLGDSWHLSCSMFFRAVLENVKNGAQLDSLQYLADEIPRNQH